MKVICHYRNDPERPLTDPLPEVSGRGFVFRLYSGDICDPVLGTLFGYQWFGPNFPKHVWRTFCRFPILPFVAWRWAAWIPFLGGRAGYAGFKLYGVDAPEYMLWPVGIKPDDVFCGSQALCLTIRPSAKIGT